LAQYLPLVKQALLVNSTLVLYYLLPNFTSFLFTALLIAIVAAPSLLQQISSCREESCCSLNSTFRDYLGLSNVRSTYSIRQS
jgi:hypothetical protein